MYARKSTTTLHLYSMVVLCFILYDFLAPAAAAAAATAIISCSTKSS